jgi:putative oxidoreductase
MKMKYFESQRPGVISVDSAALCLRLAMGIGFIVHGWAKISRGTAGFGKLLAWIGVPFPLATAAVTSYIELIGGILLILGLWTRFITIPLAATMLVAMFTIHIHYGFSSIKTIGLTPSGPLFGPPGYEINIVYLGGLLALMFLGSGKWSLGRLFAKKRFQ